MTARAKGPRAPRGYRIVTRGRVREGDILWDDEWFPPEKKGDPNSFVGAEVEECECVARPLKPRRRAARGKR